MNLWLCHPERQSPLQMLGCPLSLPNLRGDITPHDVAHMVWAILDLQRTCRALRQLLLPHLDLIKRRIQEYLAHASKFFAEDTQHAKLTHIAKPGNQCLHLIPRLLARCGYGKTLLHHFDPQRIPRLVEEAILARDYPLIEKLYWRKAQFISCDDDPDVAAGRCSTLLQAACQTGDQRLFHELQKFYFMPVTSLAIHVACLGGHRHMIDHLLNKHSYFDLDYMAVAHAAAVGDIDLARWIMQHPRFKPNNDDKKDALYVTLACAVYGQFSLLAYFTGKLDFPVNSSVVEHVCRCGETAIVIDIAKRSPFYYDPNLGLSGEALVDHILARLTQRDILHALASKGGDLADAILSRNIHLSNSALESMIARAPVERIRACSLVQTKAIPWALAYAAQHAAPDTFFYLCEVSPGDPCDQAPLVGILRRYHAHDIQPLILDHLVQHTLPASGSDRVMREAMTLQDQEILDRLYTRGHTLCESLVPLVCTLANKNHPLFVWFFQRLAYSSLSFQNQIFIHCNAPTEAIDRAIVLGLFPAALPPGIQLMRDMKKAKSATAKATPPQAKKPRVENKKKMRTLLHYFSPC